ncbi:MAG TPA: hypothetical protein VG166_04120 [Caulobacteraceae bacterium]|nr:hypothetical protein [Caulobacteraceae bacterium]
MTTNRIARAKTWAVEGFGRLGDRAGPMAARAALIVMACVGPTSLAHGQGVDILGRWIIAKAQVAPWAQPGQMTDRGEERRLVGRMVTFAAHSVTGPDPLGCARATYAAHNDTADMLFEGSLAEPGRDGRPRDPVAVARTLGMTTHTVETVETSCSEVAYHRLAPATLVFGLDNRIYTLHRAPAAR